MLASISTILDESPQHEVGDEAFAHAASHDGAAIVVRQPFFDGPPLIRVAILRHHWILHLAQQDRTLEIIGGWSIQLLLLLLLS